MKSSSSKIVHVVNHQYGDLSIEADILGKAGYQVEEAFGSTSEELLEKLRNTSGIICIYAQLNEDVLRQLKFCRAISRPGVGYDMIDVKACRQLNIQVSYLPSYGNGEVASHAAALTLSMHQRLLEHHACTSAGQWDFKLVEPVRSLKDCTIGVIGLGRIGCAFATRMAPFVKSVLGYDPQITAAGAGAPYQIAALDKIYDAADMISLHCPLTESNYHLLDEAAFSRMQRTPLIVNVSRGGLIDTHALIGALNTGKISAVALDVLEEEPLIPQALLGRNNVLLTPHAAWRSRESEIEIRSRSADELVRMLKGEAPLNPAP